MPRVSRGVFAGETSSLMAVQTITLPAKPIQVGINVHEIAGMRDAHPGWLEANSQR
jgi:hypothetical protein